MNFNSLVTMSSIMDRIEAYRVSIGVSSAQFAEVIGMKPNNYTKQKKQINPSYGFIATVLNAYPDLSSEYVMRGEGPMFRSSASSAASINHFDLSKNKAVGDHNTVGDTTSVTPDLINRLLDQNTQLIQAITDLKK